jgi:hypothetical protein
MVSVQIPDYFVENRKCKWKWWSVVSILTHMYRYTHTMMIPQKQNEKICTGLKKVLLYFVKESKC